MSDERKPWDQLENEPDAAYARFLFYRNLGPMRSLDSAYQAYRGKAANGRKRQQASGQWQDESAKYSWLQRARLYDIETLSQVGCEAVTSIVVVVREVAKKLKTALEDPELKPKDWESVLKTIDALSKCLPAEAVSAILSDSDLEQGNKETDPANSSEEVH